MKLEKLISLFEKILIIAVICMLIFFGFSNIILTAVFSDTRYDGYSEKINYVLDNVCINIGLLFLFFIIITKILPKYAKKTNIYLIAFIHFLLGIFWALFSKAPSRADQLMVTEIAKEFINGNFSKLNPGGYLCHHPMQLSIVYYVKWIYTFFGTQDDVIFFVLNSLYTMITFIYIYKISILIFDKEKIENNLKIFIFGFFILDILSIFIYGNLMGLAFSIVSLYYLFKYYKFNKKIDLLISVIFMIFSMSIKSNFLVYYIGLAISLIIYGLKNKSKSKLLISIIAIIMIFSGYKTIEFALVKNTEKNYRKRNFKR